MDHYFFLEERRPSWSTLIVGTVLQNVSIDYYLMHITYAATPITICISKNLLVSSASCSLTLPLKNFTSLLNLLSRHKLFKLSNLVKWTAVRKQGAVNKLGLTSKHRSFQLIPNQLNPKTYHELVHHKNFRVQYQTPLLTLKSKVCDLIVGTSSSTNILAMGFGSKFISSCYQLRII